MHTNIEIRVRDDPLNIRMMPDDDDRVVVERTNIFFFFFFFGLNKK